MLVKSETPDLRAVGVIAKLSGRDPAVLAEEIRRGDMTDGELCVEHVRETGASPSRSRRALQEGAAVPALRFDTIFSRRRAGGRRV